MRVSLTAASLLLLFNVASAENSVVLGAGIGNSYLYSPECGSSDRCMNAVYLWTLRVKKTIAGPPVRGVIRAISSQHTDATTRFVRSVEIFVLSPIDTSEGRKAAGADFSIMTLSPRDKNGRYCLNERPEPLGLKVPTSHVTVDPPSGYFCFPKSDVTP